MCQNTHNLTHHVIHHSLSSKLFFKLLKNEIKGKIFRVIENMYKGCIAGVKYDGSVSAMFEYRKGVR